MIAANETYDEEYVINELKREVETYRTKDEAARALGISRVFLWRVLEGKIHPPVSILERIGFTVEKETTYRYRKTQ